jgi:uncharacterized lipoprotein
MKKTVLALTAFFGLAGCANTTKVNSFDQSSAIPTPTVNKKEDMQASEANNRQTQAWRSAFAAIFR